VIGTPDILRVRARTHTRFTIRGELLGYFCEVRSSHKSDDDLLPELFQEVKHFFGDFLWPRQIRFDSNETKERTCLAGVRVPSTSNRTSFLMGRSMKDAIEMETMRTWYERKEVNGNKSFQLGPILRPKFSYAKRKFDEPPATIISAFVYIRR
jgi:hypothetical protein